MPIEKTVMGERLKLARNQLKMTQEVLAEPLGVPWSSIRDIEIGKKKLSSDLAVLMEKAHGINLRWLLTGKGSIFLPKEGERKDTGVLAESGLEMLDCGLYAVGDKVYLPLSSVTACCGSGFDVFENYNIGDAIAVSRKNAGTLRTDNVPFVVQTEGRSMEGFGIKEGSMVVVNPAEDVYSGCVAMVVYDEQASIKKIYDTPDGKDLIASNGTTLHVSDETLREGWGARIVGRVMYVMAPPDEGV